MGASTRGPFGTARPLSLAALDAAISETIGAPVRADRLARDDRVYRAICRWAIKEGSLRFNCTHAQLAKSAGYAVPPLTSRAARKEARRRRQSTIFRALSSLERAGLLRFHPTKQGNGKTRCLSVGFTPAGYGSAAPFGRSQRRPTRRPGSRISFSFRSGSPAKLVNTKNGQKARACPREPKHEASSGPVLPAELAGLQTERPPPALTWSTDRFDPELVQLVELYEEEFEKAARFSYRRHGPFLRRVLDRFDRFAGPGEGMRLAELEIVRWGRFYRGSNVKARKVKSLAYLTYKLDRRSKKARRKWRQEHGATTRGPTDIRPAGRGAEIRGAREFRNLEPSVWPRRRSYGRAGEGA